MGLLLVNEYLIVKGRNFYLVSRDTDEGYAFSEYGRSIGKIKVGYAFSLGGNIQKVDIISILYDVNSDTCEIYLKGKKQLIKGKGMSVYSLLKKNFKPVTFVPFRVIREDAQGLNQLLIPIEEGSTELCDVLNSLN